VLRVRPVTDQTLYIPTTVKAQYQFMRGRNTKTRKTSVLTVVTWWWIRNGHLKRETGLALGTRRLNLRQHQFTLRKQRTGHLIHATKRTDAYAFRGHSAGFRGTYTCILPVCGEIMECPAELSHGCYSYSVAYLRSLIVFRDYL